MFTSQGITGSSPVATIKEALESFELSGAFFILSFSCVSPCNIYRYKQADDAVIYVNDPACNREGKRRISSGTAERSIVQN